MLVVTGLTVAGGLRVASAQSSATKKDNIVDKIATTFNLDKAEVQKVFDQDRDERKAKLETNLQEKLADAVKNGSLTQEQANKIEAKYSELKTIKDSLKGKSRDERHKAMKAKRNELEQWAKANNIPNQFSNNFMRFGGYGGHEFKNQPSNEQEN